MSGSQQHTGVLLVLNLEKEAKTKGLTVRGRNSSGGKEAVCRSPETHKRNRRREAFLAGATREVQSRPVARQGLLGHVGDRQKERKKEIGARVCLVSVQVTNPEEKRAGGFLKPVPCNKFGESTPSPLQVPN